MNAGYSFIPVGSNKRPYIDSWDEYQYRRPDRDELGAMPFLEAPNVAIIAGSVSGNVECIDFDLKNDPSGQIFAEWSDLLVAEGHNELAEKLYIQETMSGGYHVVYRADNCGRNQGLAWPENGTKPIIETRGNGGYFLVPPSGRYKAIQGHVLDLPKLANDERNILIDKARELNKNKSKTWSEKVVAAPRNRIDKDLSSVMEKILSEVEEKQIDLTSEYEDWIKVGHSIAHQFGEDGRNYYHRLSQFWVGVDDQGRHASYSVEETNRKYDNLIKQRPKRQRQTTIRTFFALCQRFGIDTSDVEKRDKIGQWIKDRALRWNQVLNQIENHNGMLIDDFMFNQMLLDCEYDLNRKITEHRFKINMFNYNQLDMYNPITELFDQLQFRHYEGDPIERFLDHLKIENNGWRPYIKKWLLSVVASAYGHPSELILVLIGEQGNGKTEFFNRLLPPGLKDYMAVDNLDQGKDSDILMSKKLIILDDEFAGKSKKDAAHLKALASKKIFSLRLPYGRLVKNLPRLAVLCGASNPEHIINDSTGNRRIIPVKLIERNYKISDSVDRLDLWAQLVQEYFQMEGGEKWTLTAEEVKYLKSESESYQAANPEREIIAELFAKGTKDDVFMTATMILSKVLVEHPGFKSTPARMGAELTQMGFIRGTKRLNGAPSYGYWVKIANSQPGADLPFS